MSEATAAQRVDDEIRTVVLDAYDRARRIIDRNKAAVRLMAEALLEHESIDAADIGRILSQAGATL